MVADLGLAFLAGLLSCASACVLPLLPAFAGYLGGVSTGSRRDARARSLLAAGLFVAGFGTAFVALGAGAGLAGAGLARYRPALTAASGAALVVLGACLAIGTPWPAREWRLHVAHRLPRTPVTAYVVGLAFAIGWTPCVGPILAAILVAAASTATAARGAALLASYSAGLGLPFLLLAAFVGPATAVLRRVRGAHAALNAVAALVLVTMGLLTLAGRLTQLDGTIPGLALAEGAHLSTVTAATTAGSPAGARVPAVTVTALDGTRLRLATLRGRPVLVTFFATWCVPCQQELPLFDAAARAHRDQRLAVVAVDYGEAAPAVSAFWRELRLQITPYLDPGGAAARGFGVGLQETGLPLTVLVDRLGGVRSVAPGQMDAGLLQARLDVILRE